MSGQVLWTEIGQCQHILNITAHVSYLLLLVTTFFKFIIVAGRLPSLVMDSEQIVLEQFLHNLCEHLGKGFHFDSWKVYERVRLARIVSVG